MLVSPVGFGGCEEGVFHSVSAISLNVWHSMCCSFRFKNVLFEIHATPVSGVFDVNAKFMGVNMDKVQLVFQVNLD